MPEARPLRVLHIIHRPFVGGRRRGEHPPEPADRVSTGCRRDEVPLATRLLSITVPEGADHLLDRRAKREWRCDPACRGEMDGAYNPLVPT